MRHHSWTLPIVALLLTAVIIAPVHAADIELVADSLSYDMAAHVRKASGNAVLTHEETRLEADEIRFDEITKVAHAIGNVRVTRPGFRLVTQDLSYDMDARSFKCGAFRAGFPPIRLEGSSAEGDADRLELHNVVVYPGEPESTAPTLAADEVVLSERKRILSVGTKPGIGSVSLFRVPKLSGKLVRVDNLYTTMDAGYDGDLGAYLSMEARTPVMSGLSLGANLDYYTRRGFLVGPSLSYDFENSYGSGSGSLSSGWIHDHGDRGEDYFADDVPQQRWFVRERHHQDIADKVYVTSYVNLMSDTAVMRDFREDYFENEQTPDNYVEVNIPLSGNLVFDSLTRFSAFGNDYGTIQRLPQLRLDLLTSPLPFGGLYQTGFVTFANTDYSLNDVHSRNKRAHAYYGLRRPFQLTQWLTLTPKAGGFAGWYDKAYEIDDDENLTELDGAKHYIGELGVDLVANFYSQWDYTNKKWGIDGLRHIVRPVVYWRRYQAYGDDNWTSTDVDTGAAPVFMPSIDLRDLEGTDYNYLYNPHFVRTGIENILQTRDGNVSRELAALNFYSDTNFNDHDLDMTYVQASISPAKFAKISFENGFDPGDMTSSWYRARLSLSSAELWRLQFYADYYQGNYDVYSASYFYQLTRNWGTKTELSYDAQEGEIDRASLAVYQNLGSFWRIRYRVYYHADDLRSNDYGMSIALAINSF